MLHLHTRIAGGAQRNAALGRLELQVVIRVGAVAERLDGAAKVVSDRIAMRAVVGDEEPTALRGRGQESGKLSERFDDRIEVVVDVQVIFFDVVDQRDDRAVVVERTIELTRLGDEDPRTAGIGAGARDGGSAGSTTPADLRTVGPDDEAWIKPALHEHVTQHGGGRALAMRSGDRHAGAQRLDLAQRLGITEDGDVALMCGQALGMIGTDRGGGDDEVAVGGQGFSGFFDADGYAFGLQRGGELGWNAVGAGAGGALFG